MSYECAIKGCGATLTKSGRLMCFEHWILVPRVLQKTIMILYKNGNPFPGYEEACANAIAQVEEALAKRARTSVTERRI